MPLDPITARAFQLSAETAASCYAVTKEMDRLLTIIDPNHTTESLKSRLVAAQTEYMEQLHLTIGDKAPELAEQLMEIAARWRAVAG